MKTRSLTKSQIPSWSKAKDGGNLPQYDKQYELQTLSQHHTKWNKPQSVPTRIRKKRCPQTPFLYNIGF